MVQGSVIVDDRQAITGFEKVEGTLRTMSFSDGIALDFFGPGDRGTGVAILLSGS